MLFNQILTIVLILISLSGAILMQRKIATSFGQTHYLIAQILSFLSTIPFLLVVFAAILRLWNQQQFFKLWNFILQQIQSNTTIIINIIETFLLLCIGLGIARTIKKRTITGLGQNHIDSNIQIFVGRIFYFVVIIIAAFWILSIWQISIGVPVTIISVLTVAITVAIQDILKNLVAGFYILLERPFHIGDQINIQINTVPFIGRIENIELRTTKLRILSGEQVTIPNALIFNNPVINNSFYVEKKTTIIITVSKQIFFQDQKSQTILQVFKNFKKIKNEPIITLISCTEEKVTVAVRFWIENQYNDIIVQILLALSETFPKAELAIQDPITLE